MQRSHNIKFKLYRLSKMIPIFCMLTFLGILSYAFSVGTVFDYAESASALDPGDTATNAAPAASIKITKNNGKYGADQNSATLVTSSGMAYRSHDVSVSAADIMNYSLVISYADGSDGLRLDNSNVVLPGAAGKTPTEMNNNTWGWSWGEVNADETTMQYYTMPKLGSIADSLEDGLLAAKNTYSEDFTKKLVFAAKFGDDATSGHYRTNVMLSLTASPQQVTTTLKDLFQLQQITPEICASTNIGEVAYLQDNRGGGYDNEGKPNTKTYMVKKLSDGNCWMTQNLNLVDTAINSTNSNVKDEYKIPASELWSEPAVDNFQKQEGAYYRTDYGLNGAHYSWLTATAGTTAVGDNNAIYDICPKGWRLPTGGSSGEFKTLYDQGSSVVGDFTPSSNSGYYLGNKTLSIGGIAVDGSAFFPAAGDVTKGRFTGVGSSGHYWSGTAYYSTAAYALSLSASGAFPTINGGRYPGYSVRCVAKKHISAIETMQEMTPEVCMDTEIGYTKALKDSRGGGYSNADTENSYYVKKLSDGNCWMLQNLKLDETDLSNATGSTKLTPANSNVTSDFDLAGSKITSLTTNNANQFGSGAGYYKAQIYNPSETVSNRQKGFGAYYSWQAANAGTSVESGEATSSICPKGWQLPTSNKSSGQTGYNYSFNGITSIKSAWIDSYPNATYPDSILGFSNAQGYVFGNTKTNINGSTVDGSAFFPAAGFVGSGSLDTVGSFGYYWSSTAYSSTDAYDLGFNSGYVDPSNNGSRYLGFSVRCVVPAS